MVHMNQYFCQYCSGPLALTGDVCSDRQDLRIGKCSRCGLIQVTDFSHVKEDHYAAEAYFPVDPALERERQYRWNRGRIARLKKWIPDIGKSRILDFGCGTGGFLERAVAEKWDIVGYDLNGKVCELHRQHGWRCVSSLDDGLQDIKVVTLFHVLEHVAKPWQFLTNLRDRLPMADTFVIEVPNTDEALNSVFQNSAYRRNHFSADHVYYFTRMTLRMVVEAARLSVEIDSQLQRYTLSNHMGWLANNKGGGQNIWTQFNDDQLNDVYEDLLTSCGVADSVFFICKKA
jgi:hypothetical protein